MRHFPLRRSPALLSIGLLVAASITVQPALVATSGNGPAGQANTKASAAQRSTSAERADVRWVRIPSGTFQMGCVPSDNQCTDAERPRHTVTLTKAYDLMSTTMTLGTFRAFAKATGVRVPKQPDWNTGDRQPVLNVTWEEASSACRWLGGRLPSEAEWERAARGSRDGERYPWGDANPIGTPGAPNGARFQSPNAVPVGTFGPNDLGLFDMAGNVYEWTADRYDEAFYAESPTVDPTGPATGGVRVVRGGAWRDDPRALRASFRDRSAAESRPGDVGARCARDAE